MNHPIKLKVLLISLTSLILTFSLGLLLNTKKAQALSGSQFNAGRIIDDAIFYNGNSMTAAEIQAFLDAKVPTCDTNGAQQSTRWYAAANRYYTRAEWGALNGYPAPYTCLKNYTENTPTKAADAYCSGTYSGGVKSASQIIKDVGSACNVSQKALIVLLQKEQSLVTDDWPWSIQYRSATGYGCPDTAACDSTYYGFFNQVYNAARQFKRYAIQPELFNYRASQTRYVQYNPDANCGGSNIFIENAATAALYNYTPYQPNQAALNNLYGTGDTCSAYGNRNFWRMVNDWFGTTNAPTFSWQPVGQSAFTDSTKTVGRGLHNTMPGDRIYVSFQARNTGNFTWSNSGSNPVRVGTLRNIDRSSIFTDSTWLGPGRPAGMKEATVAPGEIGTFEFWIRVPANAQGQYNEYFGLVSEGNAWFPDQGLYFAINCVKATYEWQLVSQYAATDETNAAGRSLINLEPGERVYVSMRIKNAGNVTWKNSGPNPINLGISRPSDRLSNFFDGGWLGQNRPARLKEATVAPGEIGTFGFWMSIPNIPGPFYEYFTPVVEGLTWMNDIGLNFYGTIKSPQYSYDLVSQYAYSSTSKTELIGLHNLTKGSTPLVGFTVRNTGNMTWKNSGPNPIGVGTSRPTERISPFFSGSWLGQTRPARMKEAAVAPGQIATFEYDLKTPTTSGTYLEYVNLVVEGRAWMPDIGINFNARVL